MVYENVWMITTACQQSVFQRWHSEKHLSIFLLPTRWRRKPAGIEITSLSPYVSNDERHFQWLLSDILKLDFFRTVYIMHSTTVDGVCASRGPSATVQLLLTPCTFRYTTCYDLRTSLCPRVYLRNYTSRLCTVTYGCGLASIWRALWCVMYFRFYGLTSYLHSADVSRLLSACKCNVSEIPVSEVCRIVDIVCSEWRHLSSYAAAD